MSLEPIIKANSEEKFRELKESYKKFEEHYRLDISHGKPEVMCLAGDSVTIYPTLRDGKIKRLEIRDKEEGLGGTVSMASPIGCFIDLEGKRYDIRYHHR